MPRRPGRTLPEQAKAKPKNENKRGLSPIIPKTQQRPCQLYQSRFSNSARFEKVFQPFITTYSRRAFINTTNSAQKYG